MVRGWKNVVMYIHMFLPSLQWLYFHNLSGDEEIKFRSNISYYDTAYVSTLDEHILYP